MMSGLRVLGTQDRNSRSTRVIPADETQQRELARHNRTVRVWMEAQDHQEVETMDSAIIFLVEDSSEGGFEARPLGDSVLAEAETFEELKTMVRNAVRCRLEETDRRSLIRLHHV